MTAPAHATVDIRLPTGERASVAPEEAAQAIAAGASYVDPTTAAQEDRAAQLEEQYGTAGQKALTLGEGALSGASFGAYDLGARALAPEYADEMAKRADVNSGTRFGGEALGVVVPSLLSGGAGALGAGARAVSAPVRGVAALGSLAEHGVASVVGREAASLGGRMAQRAAAVGAQGLVEGAIYGAGHEISDSALHDHQLTAERLYAGAKNGAIFGLLGGGVLGAGGEAVSTGARAIGRRVSEALGGEGSSIGSLLRNEAEEQAFKATGAKIRDYERLGKTAEEQSAKARQIGRTLLDEDVVTATAEKGDMAAKVRARVKEVGEDLGAMRKELDKAPARFDVNQFLERAKQEVMNPLAEMPGRESDVRAVAEYLNQFTTKAGESPTFEKMFKFRQDLDDQLRPLYDRSRIAAAPEKLEQLAKVRNILEDELTTAGNRASEQIGGSFAEKYQTTKELFSRLKTAEKILGKESARESANRAVSLTDTIMGGAGLVGGLMHGPIGALGGIAAAGANKLMRTYGNQIAADVLNRATTVRAIQAASTRVEDRIGQSVSRFLSSAKQGAEAGALESGTHRKVPPTRAAYDQSVSFVREAKANPEAFQAKIAQATTPIAHAAPNVTTAMAMTAIKGVDFLASKAPPPHVDVFSLKPAAPLPRSKTLSIDEFRYLRFQEGVEHPMSVLDGLEDGTISREGVEAVREVYPKLYETMQRSVWDALSKEAANDQLDEQKAIRLGILLDMPTHYTLDPAFIAAMQATKLPPEQAPTQQAPKQGGSDIDWGTKDLKTASENIQQ